jgi:AraC-like DNA-binding protein
MFEFIPSATKTPAAPGLWADASDIAYKGASEATRREQTWRLVHTAVIDVREGDRVDLDLRAPFCRLIVNKELAADEWRIGVDKKMNARGALDAPLSYIPPNTAARAEMDKLRYLRHVVLQFSLNAVSDVLGDDADVSRLQSPNLSFADENLTRLTEMALQECLLPQESSRLFIDGLSIALFSALARSRRSDHNRSGLAPWQLRRVTDFMMANLAEDFSLTELAQEARLSRSYFCRAFKMSTGMTPHQWQLRARTERAKQLMLGASPSLALVAQEIGFADQGHFTRVFNRIVGTARGEVA